MMRRHTPLARGFTLIEVVVSIFIIGIIFVASAMLLHGVQSSRVTRNEDLALKIAGNEIEMLRAGGYATLPPSGSPFTDSSLASLASSTATVTTADYDAKTKRVAVTVSWVESDGATHAISLSTLVAAVGGLQ